MTLKPIWNWRSKTLIFFSIIFFLIFSVATFFLGFHVILQLLSGIDRDSIAAAVLSVIMITMMVVWFKGILSLRNTEYSLYFKDDIMIWNERSSIGIKKHKISLAQISHTGCRGDNKVGFSLLVQCSGNTYRLGALLTEESLHNVTELILDKKEEYQSRIQN